MCISHSQWKTTEKIFETYPCSSGLPSGMCGGTWCPVMGPGWDMGGGWWFMGMLIGIGALGGGGGGAWWCGVGAGWCGDGFHPASSRAEEPPCSHARVPLPCIAQVDLALPRGLRVCKKTKKKKKIGFNLMKWLFS